jgi:hypothetical protein
MNGILIKLSSFPGFILNNTAGTIQLASTLTDPMIQNILTRIEESRNYEDSAVVSRNVKVYPNQTPLRVYHPISSNYCTLEHIALLSPDTRGVCFQLLKKSNVLLVDDALCEIPV